MTEKQHRVVMCRLNVRKAECELHEAMAKVSEEKATQAWKLRQLENTVDAKRVEVEREMASLELAIADEERGFDQ